MPSFTQDAQQPLDGRRRQSQFHGAAANLPG